MNLLTYEQASVLYHVSRRRLNTLVASGMVEAYRPGKRTMLSARSLEIWFASTKIKPVRKAGRPRKGAARV